VSHTIVVGVLAEVTSAHRLPRRVISDTLCSMTIGELLRSTRERHGLTQARLARRIGSDRAYVSRVESGEASPTVEWARRAMAAMGDELVLTVRRSRFDDHDPSAHRLSALGTRTADSRTSSPRRPRWMS
jgi:ribosome-binding protein aMBF1 (putative translation factor)